MLKKNINLFFYVFLIFPLTEGCMKSNQIISDVLSLDKPKNFQPIVINDILKKYVYVGMPEKDAVEVFRSDGFSINENEKDAQNPAQKSFHAIYYVVNPLFPNPAPYKIVANISVVDGKVSEFSGVYLKRMGPYESNGSFLVKSFQAFI